MTERFDRIREWWKAKMPRFWKEDGLDPVTKYLIRAITCAVLIALIGLWFYNRTHLFDSFRITSSSEENDVEGTQYELLGGHIIKYSHDGVFCVNTDNETLWSSAYSMQTPVAAVCRDTMVIAEQQGNQVYVINAKGPVGQFKTTLPILKAQVSSSGVTALVLDDDEITWINLYDRNGGQIASVRTTMDDSGYPLDVAITNDAKRMMVSFLCNDGENLTGKICFYDFTSASEADESHLAGSVPFEGKIFPDVFYTSSGMPVAVADDGFVSFSSGRRPKTKAQMTFDREIISVFYDNRNIGFVFRSNETDIKYDMAICNYQGKTAMTTSFNFDYSGIRMDDEEILLYDASRLYVYRTSGRPKLQVAYGKEVKYFASLSGLRRYLVITADSMDRIHIE